MTLELLKNKLNKNKSDILFSEVIEVIENYYIFKPTAFKNGNLENKAEENSGSCKIFAFALQQKLSKEETLLCFGEHYRNVLENKDGTSHQNIRNFMKFGYESLTFSDTPLLLKS
ncbi:MAG: HopJ type III effector protein [Polaribacter sp.]|jgi:hypothetical protein